MSRWFYQMSETAWPAENYRQEVSEGQVVRWPTRKLMFAYEPPAAGDIIVCFYAPTGSTRPGVCGIGIITKYLPNSRKFDWLALPPTDLLKERPWWDERAKEIAELIRAQSPRGTMYVLPAALDSDIRRGAFSWAQQ